MVCVLITQSFEYEIISAFENISIGDVRTFFLWLVVISNYHVPSSSVILLRMKEYIDGYTVCEIIMTSWTHKITVSKIFLGQFYIFRPFVGCGADDDGIDVSG